MTELANPQTLPARTPLTGDNAIAWAEAILANLRAPVNDTNVGYMLGWFNREGGGGQNNPMNTTLHTSGSIGEVNSVGVQNYSTPSAGVAATGTTLHNYTAIVDSLRAGKGIPNSNSAIESELSRWSGGGYTSITPVKVTLPSTPKGPSGVARFEGSVNLATGEWNIRGIAGSGHVDFGTENKKFAAEIEVSVGRGGGKWRVRGEPSNSKPLGK